MRYRWFRGVYHRVRKVHVAHMMLDRRTTIMAFIEWTDFHKAITRGHRSRKLSVPLQKALNQAYSNNPQQYRFSHHRHSNSFRKQV